MLDLTCLFIAICVVHIVKMEIIRYKFKISVSWFA
jgi:hypothetical protein